MFDDGESGSFLIVPRIDAGGGGGGGGGGWKWG